MPDRLLSLAAGTVLELSPVDTVRAAAAAGWDATGLWFDADTWTSQTTAAVRAALDDTGISALDLEPIFITPNGDHGDQMIDIAAELGVPNILTVGLGVDDAAMIERLAQLGARADEAGVTVALEFGRLFATPDLATAIATVEAVGTVGLSILVDALHLARSGDTPAAVSTADPNLLRYVQLCDATGEPESDLRTDALDDRRLLGDGELPVIELVDTLPDHTAISIELRSAALRDDHEPFERARMVRDNARVALGW